MPASTTTTPAPGPAAGATTTSGTTTTTPGTATTPAPGPAAGATTTSGTTTTPAPAPTGNQVPTQQPMSTSEIRGLIKARVPRIGATEEEVLVELIQKEQHQKQVPKKSLVAKAFGAARVLMTSSSKKDKDNMDQLWGGVKQGLEYEGNHDTSIEVTQPEYNKYFQDEIEALNQANQFSKELNSVDPTKRDAKLEKFYKDIMDNAKWRAYLVAIFTHGGQRSEIVKDIKQLEKRHFAEQIPTEPEIKENPKDLLIMRLRKAYYMTFLQKQSFGRILATNQSSLKNFSESVEKYKDCYKRFEYLAIYK